MNLLKSMLPNSIQINHCFDCLKSSYNLFSLFDISSISYWEFSSMYEFCCDMFRCCCIEIELSFEILKVSSFYLSLASVCLAMLTGF